MKYVICFLLLVLISCKHNQDTPVATNTNAPTAFDQIKQVAVRSADSPLGQVFHSHDTNKDVLVFGTKNSYGYLKQVQFVLVTDASTKEWILYEFNASYLPIWARLSKGYTIGFTNYNMTNRTVTVTGYQTDTRAKLGSMDGVKLDQNVFDWATSVQTILDQDLRTARVASQCSQSQYKAAAAGYFAVNAAGCALGISEFGTGLGIPAAILSIYNTYQSCKSALGVLGNIASGQPAVGCPSAQDIANNGASCLEGELNAFSGNPYNFVQSCASGILANAAAAAACNCDPTDDPLPARSTGDPHLRTLDELYYDFQAYGEFTALKATAGDLEIQVRQEDYNNTGVATVNTGVAVRMGSDVVCVLVNPNRLYVNKVLKTDAFTSLPLSNGTTLTKDGNDLTLTNAQNEKVAIQWRGGFYLLDYLVTLKASRAGQVSGLLGNFDGTPGNDLMLSTGAAVNRFTDNITGPYADSWRIQQAQSLFVYEAGKTTDSYTNRNFPRTSVTLTDERKQWAEGICQNAGISDPTYLQDCMYDVAITGEPTIVESAAWGQKADGVPTALPLAANSDFNQFLNVRLELSSTQTDLDQLNLLDFDAGKVYKLRDGAAHAAAIDAVGSQYCGSNLTTPATIRTCDQSCGTGPIWNVISNQNWPTLQRGTLLYVGANNNPGLLLSQWNSIQQSSDIKALVRSSFDKDNTFSSVVLESSGTDQNTCLPTYLQNRFLYTFITGQGKLGLFRITGNGTTAEGRRWYTLDIRIQK